MEKNDYAIIVGINKYEHLSPLKGPVNDARCFRDWLLAADGGNVPPEHIKMVLSESETPHACLGDDLPDQASLSSVNYAMIEEKFDELISIADDSGEPIGRRLYVFLAGHGVGATINETVVLMSNGDYTRRTGYHIPGRSYIDWFRTAALFEEVVLFMDCCRDIQRSVTLKSPPWPPNPDPGGADVKYCFGFGTKWSSKKSQRRADLFNASVLMTRLEQTEELVEGFDPGKENLRTTELARLGLAEQRQAMPHWQLKQMLSGKEKDPMQGIYGSHMLLLEKEIDVDLLQVAIENLRELVGDHPDVMALAVKLALEKEHSLLEFPPFEMPPMLRSSWQILVEASSRYAHLVPAGSLTARISDAIWAEGALLTWRVQDILPVVKIEQIGQSVLESTVEQLAERLSDPNWLNQVEIEQPLNSLELGLLRHLVNTAYQFQPPDYFPKQRYSRNLKGLSPDMMLSEESLVQALNAPSASINQTAQSLMGKLEIKI